MNNGYTEQIRDRIINAPEGSVFVNSDFADIADNNTIKQSINRLIQEGVLRRVIRGVFDAPCGDTALNMLGLSTQVTAVWSYISDGPYKTYEWDKTKIEFKHRTNKEVTGLSPMTILVIQALKTLGKEHVDEKTIRVLSHRLNEDEKTALLAEGAEATDWIYTVIKEICKGEREND